MPSNDHWIAEIIAKGQSNHPLVTDSALKRMKEIFSGGLCEHKFSKKELTTVAQLLIRDMNPPILEAKIK